jgi:cerevisin
VNIQHTDFEGRAVWGKTTASGATDTDKNGHGTHVSGTIAGKTYGVAKLAKIIAVKVLGDDGTGSTADVLAGVNYVAAQHKAKPGARSVANMSLGGGKSASLDAAVNSAVAAGVSFVVAAGNSNADACNYSPAAAADAITVGASTITDTLASFSNKGKCVDIIAPGQDIKSTWIGSTTATNTISGTSMASPHVAGAVAVALSQQNLTPKQVKEYIIAEASVDKIRSIPTATVNKLLYVF